MRKKYFTFILIPLLFIMMFGCSPNNEASSDIDESQEDKQTLSLGKTPWTSTVPPTEIAKIILEDMGYKIEEKHANLGVVFAGLDSESLNIFMDYWEPQHEHYLEKYSDSVEVVSTSYENADWGLAVPKYMKEVNDVGDLKGMEDILNNEILAIEESDPAVDDIPHVVDTYDLDLETVHSSEAGMLTEAKSRIDEEEPVVLFGWRPHSMFEMLDIKLLTNEKATEYFESATVHIVAHKGLKKKAPDAYEFLSNWELPIDDVEDMIAKIDNGEDPVDVAQTWIDQNQEKVDEMIGK